MPQIDDSQLNEAYANLSKVVNDLYLATGKHIIYKSFIILAHTLCRVVFERKISFR